MNRRPEKMGARMGWSTQEGFLEEEYEMGLERLVETGWAERRGRKNTVS